MGAVRKRFTCIGITTALFNCFCFRSVWLVYISFKKKFATNVVLITLNNSHVKSE